MQQQHDEALKHYAAAIRLAPNVAGAHLNYALSLEKLGRADEALAQFREAFRLDPESFEPAYHLSRSLVQRGRFAEATRPLAAAVRVRPGHARARFLLGLAEARSSQSASGIVRLRESLEQARAAGQTNLATEIEAILNSSATNRPSRETAQPE
jgi:tetratricopeptide (TPR) repeat protein